MNDLAFIASVVGSLAIPVTIVAALVIFRRPLAELIGRVSTYEGLGQKVTFGQKLAGDERSVNEAAAQDKSQYIGIIHESVVASAKLQEELRQQAESTKRARESAVQEQELTQLAEMASANPSFTIIKAWEELSDVLTRLAKEALPNTAVRNPVYLLPELVESGLIGESFVKAFFELFDLRNRVAHGEHNPTAGEAVTYVESVRRLVSIADRTTALSAAQRASLRQFEKARDRDHASDAQPDAEATGDSS
jgi:hypothetical protein